MKKKRQPHVQVPSPRWLLVLAQFLLQCSFSVGGELAVVDSSWPKVDVSALVQENVQIIAQVNGKLRAKIMAPLDSNNQTIQEIALADEKIEKFTTNKQILKVIVVPNKLINIVVKD